MIWAGQLRLEDKGGYRPRFCMYGRVRRAPVETACYNLPRFSRANKVSMPLLGSVVAIVVRTKEAVVRSTPHTAFSRVWRKEHRNWLGGAV